MPTAEVRIVPDSRHRPGADLHLVGGGDRGARPSTGGVIDWSWWWVVAPLWLPLSMTTLVFAGSARFDQAPL
jgi:hypothetical protein